MEKEFVTYDQALALKELGFDIPVNASWIINKMYPQGIIGFGSWQNYNSYDDHLSAPLKQQVFRWFREKYNINSHIEYYPSSEDTVAYFFIADEDESINYGTYEEAEEKCIKFLIETVKNM